jgi:hypothetical protein
LPNGWAGDCQRGRAFATLCSARDNSAISHHVNGAQQAAFSLTQTSATIGGKTYDMSFGNVQAGVARTINLIRQPGANEYCIDGMTLTKQ